MNTELVYAVHGSAAIAAEPVSMAEANLRERDDLQEWVLAHPEILGADVMVVAFEFDQWAGTRTGDRERDRLDVLGLDSTGRLVVAELKRDRAPDTVNMQAIKYAALTSRFDADALVEHYVNFRRRAGDEIDDEQALEELVSHAGELDETTLTNPRIVLVAGDYPPVVTATVVWLTERGLDITMQRVQAYRLPEGNIIVTVSQLFPIAEVEEFTVSPLRQQARTAKKQQERTREKSTVLKLIATRALADGTPLTMRATTEVPLEVRTALDEWIAEDPRRGRARWYNRRQDPLVWEYSGAAARPTPIVAQALAEAAGITKSPRGPAWWVTEDGRDLPTIAGDAGGGFDWRNLHELLGQIPAGRWVTYGDLADVIGTAAMPVGNHLAKCEQCINAHRVLGGNGKVRPNFAWTDPHEMRTPKDILAAEGVRFTGDVADRAQQLKVEDLRQWVTELPTPPMQ